MDETEKNVGEAGVGYTFDIFMNLGSAPFSPFQGKWVMGKSACDLSVHVFWRAFLFYKFVLKARCR